MSKFTPAVPLDQRLASFELLGHAIRFRFFVLQDRAQCWGRGGEGVWWPGLWISTVLERGAEGVEEPGPVLWNLCESAWVKEKTAAHMLGIWLLSPHWHCGRSNPRLDDWMGKWEGR